MKEESPNSLYLNHLLYALLAISHARFHRSILVPWQGGRDVLLAFLGRRLAAGTLDARALLAGAVRLVWLFYNVAPGQVMHTALGATEPAASSWSEQVVGKLARGVG